MAKDRWDMVTGYCCSTCRFYVPKEKKGTPQEIGRCRRNAPVMDGYPVVYATQDFCGNHKIGTNPLK